MNYPRSLSYISLLLLLTTAACGSLGQPPQATPGPTVLIVEPATQRPAETQAPAPTASEYAQFCQVASPASNCSPPQVELRDKFCQKKVPYTLLALPAGSNYQVLESGYECSDTPLEDGSLMLTCYGPQLESFMLEVCNPACAAPQNQADLEHCPQGYVYDAAQECCAAAPPEGQAGCAQVKVDLRACPGPN